MDLYSVFVTGANRGIGLEFVRQLACLSKPPKYVFATFRSSETLKALMEVKNSSKDCNVELIKMDVTKQEDIVTARKVIEQAVGENGLTLLINNAGVLKFESFPNITEENLLMHFTINTIGPIKVFQEMLPLLQKAAARNSSPDGMRASRASVLNISAGLGSLTNTPGAWAKELCVPGYKISKAGLNMAMRVAAANVKNQGILVVMMCPGWVKTDMGTEEGLLDVEESISDMLKTLSTLNESHHAAFMDRKGKLYAF